jgi:uncharacterized protein involved in outer membrane biogenesis
MRRHFRWGLRLVLGLLLLAAVCGVAVVFLRDTIAKDMLIRRLRSATGGEVKISAVHVGLLSPTLTIEGFKLYNTADFGGTLCLDMPELHIEYDRSALRARKLHLTLLRLDLAELSELVDKNGRKNFGPPPKQSKEQKESTKSKDSSGQWKFIGIDVMNATLGTFHVSNLASGEVEKIEFGVTNQILHHVKSWSDLAPLGLTTLSRGKATSADGNEVDLGQLLDSVLKAP